MAQVVETDAFHLVRCQKNRKMLREIIRVHMFSHRIYIDIVEIVRAIAFAADLPVKLLLLFYLFEHLLTGRDKRKCPAT